MIFFPCFLSYVEYDNWLRELVVEIGITTHFIIAQCDPLPTSMQWPFLHTEKNTLLTQVSSIGFYREIAIAIQKESGDSNGGNV